MSLQDTLDAFKHNFETNVAPAEAVAAFHRFTDEQIASGQADNALNVGDRAPEFTLPDANGNPVSSAELLKAGPLVVTFYRGFWCPYCNIDLKAIEAAAADIRAKGASLVAISQQTAATSRKAETANGLSFPILGDHGGELADKFGIRYVLADYLKPFYLGFQTDLAVINGEPSWTLPMPARYVIGQDGIIAYAEINPDYTRRPDPSELTPVLDRLRAKQTA